MCDTAGMSQSGLSEKIRRRYPDLPQQTRPVQIFRAVGVALLVACVVCAVICAIKGEWALAADFGGIALVPAGLIAAQTRFIRDRKAGRPLQW